MKIKIFDSTLRDGVQSETMTFSTNDKLALIEYLDTLGIDFIEGGIPASNPKDFEFFTLARNVELKHSKLVAFTSTHKVGVPCEKDETFLKVLQAETEYVTVFGKSWDLHVKEILNTDTETNLSLIYETVSFLTGKGKKVIFDAEHYFDGFKADRDYALKTVKTAEEAGAVMVTLCDTNGGCFPFEIEEIVTETKKHINCELGIHTHNDIGMADANTISAVRCGATCVQGTFGGYGERCGNANLCTLIPDLQLKLGYDCIGEDNIKKLTKISRAVCEIANMNQFPHAPYVGRSAFVHKGGIHIDAVEKNPVSYEHTDPSAVGNKRKIVVSEMAGRSALLRQIQKIEPDMKKDSKKTISLLEKMKELEHIGYDFGTAQASNELFILRELGKYTPHFKLAQVNVFITMPGTGLSSIANIKISVDGKYEITSAEGDGPVNALDSALRKALRVFYPEIKKMRLADFKVRALDSGDGTASRVRVMITSTDGHASWRTMGVSTDLVEASWKALLDSIEYYLGNLHEK